jgi:hypothetical protein
MIAVQLFMSSGELVNLGVILETPDLKNLKAENSSLVLMSSYSHGSLQHTSKAHSGQVQIL